MADLATKSAEPPFFATWLNKELLMIRKEPLPEGIVTCEPEDPNNLGKWVVTLKGPKGSPYEGGMFSIVMTFGSDYPLKPPNVLFKTRIYHPNISSGGTVCISSLKEEWSPAIRIPSLLLGIMSLMANPNPEDPLVVSIADQYVENRETFKKIATAWTKKFAIEK